MASFATADQVRRVLETFLDNTDDFDDDDLMLHAEDFDKEVKSRMRAKFAVDDFDTQPTAPEPMDRISAMGGAANQLMGASSQDVEDLSEKVEYLRKTAFDLVDLIMKGEASIEGEEEDADSSAVVWTAETTRPKNEAFVGPAHTWNSPADRGEEIRSSS